VRRRSSKADTFAVRDVAERLAWYDIARAPAPTEEQIADDDLVDRAATLLVVMPPNQSRKTIEELLAPHDPDRGRRAVDALIDSALAVEDHAGHLRRLG
jgi:hypothetical protein